MKKILLFPLLGALFLALGPAAQAATLADIDLVNATINEAGVVKVVGEITCPAGYDVTVTRASIEQRSTTGGEDLHSRARHFLAQVNCTGSADRFVVRFRESTQGDPFEADALTAVDLSFTACPHPPQPKPDASCVSAEDVTTVVL